MNERQEGFWWARWKGSPEWSVLQVHNPGDTYFHGSDVPLAEHEMANIEWGDYLGKSPSDTTRLVRADERKRIAQWVRYNADCDYLQEDTFGGSSLDSFALADAIEALESEPRVKT